MKTNRPVLVSKTIRLLSGIIGQKQGITPLQFWSTNSGYTDIGTTASDIFAPLFTQKITIDFYGYIDVLSIFLHLITNNDPTGECIVQISGDAGNTFIPMTDAIGTGIDLFTKGAGAWINNIAIGNDGLQIQILGRSTILGNPATIRMSGYASTIEMLLSKKLI